MALYIIFITVTKVKLVEADIFILIHKYGRDLAVHLQIFIHFDKFELANV
jgi:hypothetical protein